MVDVVPPAGDGSQGRRGPRSSASVLEDVVLGCFRPGERLTRPQIVERTGLSRPVVTGVVDRLLASRRLSVAASPSAPDRRGRPPARYERTAGVTPVVVIHLRHGGTATANLVEADLAVRSVPVGAPWTSRWRRWAPALRGAWDALGCERRAPERVVLATPFPARRGHGLPPALAAAPSHPTAAGPDWLRDDPISALTGLFGPGVVVVNDANLAALAEARFGAGRGAGTVVHVSVKDGIGAGIVLGGRLHTGRNGMAGELAHVQVDENGPLCPCGNRGCLATQTTNPLVVEALTARYGHHLTFEDVEALIETGDPVGARFFRDLGALVGRPLSTIVTTLDPDVVIVDACLGAAARPFITGLTSEIALRCPPVASSVSVVVGELPDAVVLGGLAADAF